MLEIEVKMLNNKQLKMKQLNEIKERMKGIKRT